MGDFPAVGPVHDGASNVRGTERAAAPERATTPERATATTATTAGNAIWRAFWGSRVVVFLAGVTAAAQLGNQPVASFYDPNRLTSPFGYFANLLVSPFARWDSAWYLAVAKWGYGPQASGLPLHPPQAYARMNFFPLYPLLIRALGFVLRSDLLAGVAISLGAFALALVLLHRLVRLDFAPEIADGTVILLAFWPMSFFFSAIYTESLFLALSLGSLYAARRGCWWCAGLLGALASATRIEGVLLLVPLVLMLPWRAAPVQRDGGHARPPSRRSLRLAHSAPWLGLVPTGLLAYICYLALRYGTGLAPFRSQSLYWMHRQSWPFAAVFYGGRAALHGLEQLLQGPVAPYRVALYAGGASFSATQDIYLFLFTVLILVAFVLGTRTLPLAYSAYALVSLALPLSDPVSASPLGSLPRYAAVIFPLFIWGAQLCARRRLLPYAVAFGAVLLGLFTAEFSTWVWVA